MDAVFLLCRPKLGFLSGNAAAMIGPRRAFEAVFDQVLHSPSDFYRNENDCVPSRNILVIQITQIFLI